MQPLNVVVAYSDAKAAETLAASLHDHFHSVCIARSLDELRRAIPRHRAEMAIVDLEMVPMGEIEELCHEFGKIFVVCTHRVPDEQMWAAALSVGAIDCCHSTDVRGIVSAAARENHLISKAAHAA